MLDRLEWHTVGDFETPSGKLLVTDPGYDLPRPGEGFTLNIIIPVPKTTWRAYMLLLYSHSYGPRKIPRSYKPGEVKFTDVKTSQTPKLYKDVRVAQLVIVSKDNACSEEQNVGSIGVDGGIAGFFDKESYSTDEDWQEMISTLLFGADWKASRNAVLVPNGASQNTGVVSSAGYGDGTYDLFVGRTKGKVSQVRLDFISDVAPLHVPAWPVTVCRKKKRRATTKKE